MIRFFTWPYELELVCPYHRGCRISRADRREQQLSGELMMGQLQGGSYSCRCLLLILEQANSKMLLAPDGCTVLCCTPSRTCFYVILHHAHTIEVSLACFLSPIYRLPSKSAMEEALGPVNDKVVIF